MDINAALKRMRQLQAEIHGITGTPTDDMTNDDIVSLANKANDLVMVCEAIDGWLSKGEPLPDAWKRN